jgi:hypothetical protein
VRAPAAGGDCSWLLRELARAVDESIPPRQLSLHDVDEMVLSDPS